VCGIIGILGLADTDFAPPPGITTALLIEGAPLNQRPADSSE